MVSTLEFSNRMWSPTPSVMVERSLVGWWEEALSPGPRGAAPPLPPVETGQEGSVCEEACSRSSAAGPEACTSSCHNCEK